MPLSESEAKVILERLHVPEDNWINPKIGLRDSPLGGKGMFAKEIIPEGETVIVWGGTPHSLFTEEDVRQGRIRKSSVAAIDEGIYLAGAPDEPREITDYINHSCDSNVWMQNAITLIVRRAIQPDQEVTVDYALFQSDEEWKASWECRCGSSNCRHTITGRDWRLPVVQERYKGHFSPFLNKRIEKITKT